MKRGWMRIAVGAMVLLPMLAGAGWARAGWAGWGGRDDPPQPARPSTPAGEMLDRVFAALNGEVDALGEGAFSPEFLKQVPMGQFRAGVERLRSQHGTFAYRGVRDGAEDRRLVARAVASKDGNAFLVHLSLDEQGRIAGLLVRPDTDAIVPELKSWADLDTHSKPLARHVAIGAYELVAQDAGSVRSVRVVHEHNGGADLAIGSTFKLWILGALAEDVREGRRKWEAMLPIRAEWKSLPSGVLQDRPAGEEIAVREHALKMISISDNTATDHLLHHVGRERVEAFMSRHTANPARNLPMFGTRELFVLKLSGSDELPKAYLAADEAGRRAMLGPEGRVSTGTPSLLAAAVWRAPRMIETLEWFATPADLARTCATLDHLLEQPGADPLRAALTTNPGLPLSRSTWRLIGYKGGSEPGVLNLTWLLHRDDERRFVLTLGFNDPARRIDDTGTMALALRAAELLGRWDRDARESERAPAKAPTPDRSADGPVGP